MKEELSLDNILGADDVENLFTDVEEETQETPPEKGEEKENKETTEVDTDTLFDEPESVGSKENTEEKEDTTHKDGTSPNNFYSSIAKAFAEEGIFPDLDDDSINNVKESKDLRELIDKQIQASLEEKQKRVDEALNAGVEPSQIRQYENTISYLDSIEDSTIEDESDKGETLRKQLIFQDFINRGYSKERAQREIKKSFDAGTDVEDAKEALKSNRDFFQEQYDGLVEDAKKEEEKLVKERKEQAETLKKSILEDKKVFGDMDLDKSTRQKVYDNISKPVFKDPESGEYLTAIQKYEMENRTEFLKNVGLIYTLTDGFKDLNGLVKSKVRREVKKGFRELEHKLNNTARTSSGSINFASGVGESESYLGKGLSLDV